MKKILLFLDYIKKTNIWIEEKIKNNKILFIFIGVFILSFNFVTCKTALKNNDKRITEEKLSQGYIELKNVGYYGRYKTCYYENEDGRNHSFSIYPTYNADGSVKTDGKGGYILGYCPQWYKP